MRPLLLTAVLLLLALTRWDDAARLVETGDLEGARRAYESMLRSEPDRLELRYNLGTVLLLQGAFDDARLLLEGSESATSVAAAAGYNAGNADLVPAFADTALAGRDERLRRAIEAYKRALRLDPGDEDAKWNLELARRLLERRPPPDDAGGGGGGTQGDGAPERGDREPEPSPAAGGGDRQGPSESPAEALLGEAQERESQVQRDRLRKPQPPGPILP
jgi:Ca-activated chloride channel homolog